jgi:hypothetical protein
MSRPRKHIKKLPSPGRGSIARRGAGRGKPVEIWFQDEARVGQKGSLEYIWAPVGSRPSMVRDNRHDSAYLFGAICHSRKVGAAIIMPSVNAEAMTEHLKVIGAQVAQGSHGVVVCDGAGWRQKGGRHEQILARAGSLGG